MGFLDGMASKLKTSVVEGALGAMGLENIVDYIEKAPNDPEKLILLLVAYGIDLKAESHMGDDGKKTYNPIVKFVGGEKVVTEVQNGINTKDPNKFPFVVKAVLRHLKLIVSMATIKQSTYMEEEFKDLGDSAIENPDQQPPPSSGETDHHKVLKENILKGLVKFLNFLEKNMGDVEVFTKDLKSYLEKPFGDDDDTLKQLREDGSLKLIENFMSTVVLQPGLLANDDFVPEEISKQFHSISNLRDYMNIRLEFATNILGTVDNSIQGDDYKNIKKSALIETLKSGAQKEKPDVSVSNKNKNTLEKCDAESLPESKQICRNLTVVYKQQMNKLQEYLNKVLGLEQNVRNQIEDDHFQQKLGQLEMGAAAVTGMSPMGMSPMGMPTMGMPTMGQPGMGMTGMPGMMSPMSMPGMMEPGMGMEPGMAMGMSPMGRYTMMRGGGKSQTMLPGWLYGFFYPAQYEEKHSKSELKKKTLKEKK